EQQLHALNREVADWSGMRVKRQLGVKAFGIDVWIEGQRGPLPGECELASGQRQPLMGHRVVGDVAPIQANRLAIEKVGQGFIGGGGVGEGARSQINAAHKVLVQLTVNAETRPYPAPIAVHYPLLKVVLSPYPHVSRE